MRSVFVAFITAEIVGIFNGLPNGIRIVGFTVPDRSEVPDVDPRRVVHRTADFGSDGIVAWTQIRRIDLFEIP